MKTASRNRTAAVFTFAFSVLLAALTAGQPAAAREKLVIAIQPTATPEKLTAQATELKAFLEKETGAEVDLRFPTDYAGVVEALRFGHAQAAFMGAWPAALATRRAGAEIALAEVREVTIGEEKAEAPHYFSYWVVRKDSPYQTLAELKGKRAAFPNPLSTSGYVAPLAKLVELGFVPAEPKPADPKKFFGEVTFAGGYAQAWAALKEGQVDVSVIAGDVPEALYKEVLAGTRILETQGPIPSHAVVFSKDLQDPLRGKLLQALLKLNEPEHRELMRKFVSGIFVRFQPADTATHLGALRHFLDRTGLEFEEKR